MTPAAEIMQQLAELGIALKVRDGQLIARPISAVPPDLAQRAREHRAEIIALLKTPAPPASNPEPPARVPTDRAAWTREHTPNSRQPLIPDAVRAKIEAIETEARAKGWPPELLWNSNFWNCPRGLAALLDPEDEIGEVASDYIAILKTRRDLLRFRRHAA